MTHKWELLSIPDVAVIYGAHKDIGQDDTDILIDLKPDGIVEAGRADEIPVEAPRQQAHALIVARATEDVAEDRACVIREAENRNTREKWEYP